MGQLDGWLSSVIPLHNMSANSNSSLSEKSMLELHQRLVHLATLRSNALEQLNELDALKATLTERKVIQQSRLIAALDSRLAAVHASIQPHRIAVHDHIKALETEAALLSSILQGTAPPPQPDMWAAATQRYKQLQQQQQCCQQQLPAAALSSALAEPLQQGEGAAVQASEQQLHQERAARLLAEEVQRSMEQELMSLRLLVEQLAVRLRLPQQQQHQQMLPQQPTVYLASAGAPASAQVAGQNCSIDALQQQQHQQQLASRQAHGSNPGSTSAFMSAAQELRQRLQQVYDAATQQCAAAHARALQQPEHLREQKQQQHEQQLQQEEFLPGDAYEPSGAAEQQLRLAVLGDSGALKADWDTGGLSSSSSSGNAGSLQQRIELREARLRQAYQQQLRQVQARYQQELQRAALQHQKAVQAQAESQTEAITRLTQQHSEACTRLAAAAAVEGDLRQQLARLQQENQQLHKVQVDASASAATAVALAQVQHEQQLLQAKQNQEQVLQDMRQQLQCLQQQIQEQASAVPTADAVAALVQQAATAQLQCQEQRYQAALDEREQQHISLLQDLSLLRQLQEEPSSASAGNEELEGAAAAAHSVLAGLDLKGNPQLQAAPGGSSSSRGVSGMPDRIGRAGSPDVLLAAAEPGRLQAACAMSAAGGVNQHQQQRQQQQSQREAVNAAASPMSALIAAVLGPGSTRAATQQAAYVQRQQDQQQQQQQQQHQLWQQLEQQCDEAAAELDLMLGLQPQAGMAEAAPAAAVHVNDDGGQLRSCNGILQTPLLDQQQHTGSCREAHVAAAADTAQQQCHQVLQCLSPVQSCSSTVSSRAGSPSREQRQQQQQSKAVPAAASSGTRGCVCCVRCGSNDSVSPGRCCFHPGLVSVPGPLLYSPEWHACRAGCSSDKPGCFTRREHYYTTNAAPSSGSCAGGISKAAAGKRGGCSSASTPAAATRGRAGSLSPSRQAVFPVLRRSGAQVVQAAGGGPRPRSILPHPRRNNCCL